jgi:DNA transformation protein
MKDLTALPNIGETLARELRKAGIDTYDDLADIGAVEATLQVARGGRKDCYNLLFALEGAIRGIRWHSIPKQDRARLKQELDRARTG